MAPAMWRKGSIKGRLATREARSFLIRAAMHTCATWHRDLLIGEQAGRDPLRERAPPITLKKDL